MLVIIAANKAISITIFFFANPSTACTADVLFSISGINKIKLPNWEALGSLAGKGINIPKIPKLAQGTVLPGGSPFLAWVNDQPRGQTNIEAPLDTIKQAVAEGVANMNVGSSNGRIEVPVYLNGRQIALAVREAENNLGSQTVFGGFANAY